MIRTRIHERPNSTCVLHVFLCVYMRTKVVEATRAPKEKATQRRMLECSHAYNTEPVARREKGSYSLASTPLCCTGAIFCWQTCASCEARRVSSGSTNSILTPPKRVQEKRQPRRTPFRRECLLALSRHRRKIPDESHLGFLFLMTFIIIISLVNDVNDLK